MTETFSAVFLIALLARTATRLWLGARQVRHVRAHREAVPAAFQDTIPLASHQRAADYTVARLRLARLDLVTSAALLWWLTLGGGLAGLYALAGQFVPAGGHAQGLVLFGLLGVVSWAVELPFELYRTFGIEARFGFNKTTWKTFFTDTLKSTLLGVALGAPLLWAVLWLMDSMGTHWWLYVWGFWCAVSLLMLWIAPTFIAPLFNTFTPLADAALGARIEQLLSRCGFESKGLFVMDGSRRSSHGNAYFTGFGRAKRIVFFDTLLERLTPDEIEAVLAHELGHYHHRHLWRRLAVSFAGSLLLFYVLGVLMQQPWFYAGLGFPAQGTAPALVLFMLVVPVFTFPLTPLMSLASRRHEFQADAFAARLSGAAHLARALVKLYRDNAATLTPDPLYSGFHDSHPPAAARIARLGV